MKKDKYIGRDYGKTFVLSCTSCRKKSYWKLRSDIYWITIFSLPLFPYRNKYFWQCDVCGNEKLLTKEQFENIRKTTQSYNDVRKEITKKLEVHLDDLS